MEIKTLNDIYTVTCTLERPAATKYKRGGQWVDTSVDEFRDTVRYFATGLYHLGLKPGDRVAILSENRPEWAMADFAILAGAAVTVPVYPTLLGWQIEYILNDSGAVAVICSNEEQMKKVAGIRDHCPHILERMGDYCYFYRGCTIAYAESVLKVSDNLREIRPQVFAAVPRLFEKMRTAILDNVAVQPASKQKIFKWALGIAEKRLPYRVSRKSMPLGLKMKSFVADKLVFSKILARLGGRVKMVLSGGAPLSAELAAFFIGAGLGIYERYGLTETSPVIAVNTPEWRKVGTVGRIIPGVEVKIAPDGEILSRGPHIMKGYWNNDDATRQAIDDDGWFHTGDIGEIDSEGFLKITDRKKDIIINAYGKNIAPQPLEAALKRSPYIRTPALIGDRRKYLAALLVPNFDKLERDPSATRVQFPNR